MTIKVTQLLELLFKADKLNLSYWVQKSGDDYIISFYEKFSDNDFEEKVTITKDGISDWNSRIGVPFDYMMDTVDGRLKNKEEEKIKAEKRKELINSLTPEQRELLGVKL